MTDLTAEVPEETLRRLGNANRRIASLIAELEAENERLRSAAMAAQALAGQEITARVELEAEVTALAAVQRELDLLKATKTMRWSRAARAAYGRARRALRR